MQLTKNERAVQGSLAVLALVCAAVLVRTALTGLEIDEPYALAWGTGWSAATACLPPCGSRTSFPPCLPPR